jgi:hypothetical protein
MSKKFFNLKDLSTIILEKKKRKKKDYPVSWSI